MATCLLFFVVAWKGSFGKLGMEMCMYIRYYLALCFFSKRRTVTGVLGWFFYCVDNVNPYPLEYGSSSCGTGTASMSMSICSWRNTPPLLATTEGRRRTVRKNEQNSACMGKGKLRNPGVHLCGTVLGVLALLRGSELPASPFSSVLQIDTVVSIVSP